MEKYSIKMGTPMGELNGMFLVQINGGNLSGEIQAMGINSSFSNGKINNGNCEFSGVIRTMIGNITYKAQGVIKDDKVSLNINSNKGIFRINGSKI